MTKVSFMRPFLAAILLTPLLAPLPAMAEDSPPPPGCTDVITVQGAGCTVRRVMTCADTNTRYGVTIYNADGPTQVSWFDADGALLRLSRGPEDDTEARDVADPISLAGLLDTGSDVFDYVMANRDGTLPTRIVGTVKLTGETVVIDDRTLQVVAARNDITAPDGTMLNRDFSAFLDVELGIMFSGLSRDASTGALVSDNTPITFILPGEPGALSITPVHGCGA
jgi:hypothetical protein